MVRKVEEVLNTVVPVDPVKPVPVVRNVVPVPSSSSVELSVVLPVMKVVPVPSSSADSVVMPVVPVVPKIIACFSPLIPILFR